MDIFSSFQVYLRSQKAPPSESTLKNYLADIKHFTKWFEDTYQKGFAPGQITSSDISQFRQFLETINYHPSTINRHISSLRKFFQFLKSYALVANNPVGELQTEEKRFDDIYHVEDFKRFLYRLGRKTNTIKNYLSDLQNFFDWIGKTDTDYRVSQEAKMEKINAETISQYKERLLSIARLSPSSINRKLSSMRLYCQWAKEEGYLAQNPFEEANLVNEGKEDLPTLPIPLEEYFANKKGYSSIPPIRLMQKISRFIDRMLITFLIAPITNFLAPKEQHNKTTIGRYIKQDFYAPLENPLLRLGKKQYVIALIILAFLGLGGYVAQKRFFPQQKSQQVSPPPREEAKKTGFSFSGRLADANGDPVTQTSTVIFSLYDDPRSFDTLLYQEVHDVTPDNDGFFTVTLEDLPEALLTTTTAVYLGTAIQGDSEMRPRQVINADKVVTSSLFNAEGSLVLPNESPTITASEGPLNITASQVILRTTQGSNGSITLWPDGIGKIDVLSPLTNSITGNVEFQDALSVNASGASDAFSVQIGGTPVFTIDKEGVLSALASQLSGSLTPAKNGTYDLGSRLLSWKTVYAQNVIGPSSGTQGYWQRNSQALSPANITDDLLIGGTATSSAKFRVASSNGNVTTSGAFTVSGASTFSSTLTFSGPANDITTASNEHLTLMPTGTGNVGIGITAPGNKLSILGSVSIGSYAFATGAAPTDGLSVSGNVGVGTSTPGATLQIAGNAAIGFGAATVGSTPNNGLVVWGNVGIGTSNPGTAQLAVLGGNVGIGTTSPIAKLDVAGGGRFTCSADFTNTDGITSCSDIAEVYSSDETLEKGDVLQITAAQKVGKTTKPYDSIVGIYSTSPGILVGGEAQIGGNDNSALPQGKVPVALAGRVPTKVSTENGPIAVGDFLTSSSIPGIAMRASKAGPVVGKALESFSCSTLNTTNENTNEHETVSGTLCQGKILVFVSVSFADPDFDLATISDFSLTPVDVSDQIPKYTVYDAVGELIEKTTAYSNGIIGNLHAGTIVAQFLTVGELISNKLQVTSTLVANVLHTNMLHVTDEIISPLAEIDIVRTNVISPLASDTVVVDGNLTTNNATVSGELTANKVSSIELEVGSDATVSGTLRAGKIIADEIVGLQAQIASLAAQTLSGLQEATSSAIHNSEFIIQNSDLHVEASSSATLTIDKVFAGTGSFFEGLLAIGPSGFSDVSISGMLSLSSQFILNNNSINVLGADLKLQPLGQGGVSIADGKIYIDSMGNLTTQGDVTIEGKLSTNIISPIPDGDLVISLGSIIHNSKFIVQNASESAVLTINQEGDIVASGSAQFTKLSIPQLIEKVKADGQKEVANTSVGKGTIRAGSYEITIETPFVTEQSLIYITPTSNTTGMIPFIARQVPGESFTVAIPDWIEHDITFNWWIIN